MRHSVSKLLSFVLALTAAFSPGVALAHQNTTSVSRMSLSWPDLGYEGGPFLHSAVTSVVTKLGDNQDSRYQEYTGVANSTVTTYTHGFGVPFSTLQVVLWSGTGSSKTLISNPTGAGWTIAAGASPTTQVAITAPSSGGPHSFSVEVKSGFGSMSTQNASGVAITGGSIAGASVSTSSATITGGTISGVDHDGGTASNTSRLTVPKASKTTIDGLTRKEATLAYASDLDKLYVDDGSTLKEVGSGTGQGEKNYVTNPSASADTTGWTASGSGITVARTTTAAELPRGATTGTAFKITPVSGTTDYVQTCFTIDEADKNKRLKVRWDQRPLSSYAAGDLKVDVLSFTSASCGGSATDLALSTDPSGSAVTSIPAYTNEFLTTFGATSADYYGIRITRVSGTSALAISDVTIGPGTVAKTVYTGPWQTYTPTIANTGAKSVSTAYGLYRRNADGYDIELSANLNTTASGDTGSTLVTASIPSGCTIDATKMPNTGALATDDNGLGHSQWFAVATASQWDPAGTVIPNTTTTVSFVRPTTGSSYTIGALNVARGIEMVAKFSVPCTELANAIVNTASSETAVGPLVYTFTNWNPSGTGPVSTDPTAGTTTLANSDITVSGPSSGTVTFTFQRTGKYQVTMNVGHRHSNSYTTGRFLPTFGGTAAYYGDLSAAGAVTWDHGANADDPSVYGSHVFTVNVTAVGQTFTFKPTFNSDGISNTAEHTAMAAVIIQPLSSIGGIYGIAGATSANSGLVSYEDSGTFSVSLTGPRSISATWSYVRVGKQVTLQFPTNRTVACTVATNFSAAAASIPAALLPTSEIDMPIFVQDNGADLASPGFLAIQTNGAVAIYKSGASGAGNFAATSNCGFYGSSVTYRIP